MNFGIYQVRKERMREAGFRRYDAVVGEFGAVRREDYACVYAFDLESSVDITLDDIYEIFNLRIPSDFKGHSLSVSDVVRVDNKYYYCDSFGWKELDWE